MTTASERRGYRRYRAVEEHAIVSARVRPGHEVALIDVSAEGVLIETDRRLLPGATIDLTLATAGDHVAVRGRVLRSFVARLRADGVAYRGAIGLDRHLPWFKEEGDPIGYPIPGADMRPRRREANPPSTPVTG